MSSTTSNSKSTLNSHLTPPQAPSISSDSTIPLINHSKRRGREMVIPSLSLRDSQLNLFLAHHPLKSPRKSRRSSLSSTRRRLFFLNPKPRAPHFNRTLSYLRSKSTYDRLDSFLKTIESTLSFVNTTTIPSDQVSIWRKGPTW